MKRGVVVFSPKEVAAVYDLLAKSDLPSHLTAMFAPTSAQTPDNNPVKIELSQETAETILDFLPAPHLITLEELTAARQKLTKFLTD